MKRVEIEAMVAAAMTAHADEIFALPHKGPRGGHNAARIPGWAKSPSSEVSRAARRLPYDFWMRGWDLRGSGKTPTTWIPACILDEVR